MGFGRVLKKGVGAGPNVKNQRVWEDLAGTRPLLEKGPGHRAARMEVADFRPGEPMGLLFQECLDLLQNTVLSRLGAACIPVDLR